uniref:A kinase-anchoring proteins AKAP-5 and AKAP-12 calmodulin (CaM)-binding domain-containing protein n=1 Tax=Periophthalmus magnuspinnatus TaxID=409849 RepID=A0A3B3ZS61_9GOBI
MGDAQSAQRDGKSEAEAQEQGAVEDGPSGESAHGKAEDKELVDMSKNVTDATLYQQEIVETSSNIEEQKEIECKEVQEDTMQAMEPSDDEDRGKSPSADQDSESEITSSQEKVQSSPFKRLFSGPTFKRRSKRQKGRRSSDSKLSDSGEHIEHQMVATSEKTEQQDAVVEPPSSPHPSTTEPEEELSAWETFKKLMTPKKSLKRASIGSEDVQVQAVAGAEETKPNEGERISDHSTEEGRKRKDSSHSWEAVLCGSGRRRSRKTSDSEDEQKQDGGEVASPNEAGDARTSTPKQADSPSDSESSTWKSFKKLMTPKRKVKDDEESKDIVQSDSEATQEETSFSIKKLLPGRKKRKSGDKQDQLSSDEGDNKEVVSVEEDSETPAVVPLSEFDKSETDEAAKTDMEIQDSDLESEQEQILEIPKTFVQEVQEYQVTPVIPLNQDQDELTEFSKYQPLSDIPEEGNITETVATSLIEDVAKDDTIAEDMVELTSEAITAPEPVDITMADETEELMLSAASHLTESSKTSGNATPVPVEYDVKETEVLLKEVVKTISTATKEDIICSEEPSMERAVSSVTHEMFERHTYEEHVMEIHAQSDTVPTETELQVDQLRDTDVELPVTVLSESLSEFKDAISTEYTSEVSKVEFESAKVEIDEVHPTQLKRAVKQESIDDSDYMIESLSEVPESVDIASDKNAVEDVLPDECHESELEAVRTESTELMSEEKLEMDNLVAEQSDIQEDAQLITSVPELPKDEVDSVVEIDKEEVEHEALVESAQINETGQVDQPEAEEIIDVLLLESAPDLHTEVSKEPSNEQTVEELQEVTETHVEAEIVVEDDFEIVYKQDVENTQESALENQNLPEDVTEEVAVQEEESMPMADPEMKEEMIENIATEPTEQGVIGENEQDVIEDQISEIIVEADKEEVFITGATTEPESREQTDDVVPEIKVSQVEDATNELLEEISEEEIIDQLVPSTDGGIMEQNNEEVSTEADQQDAIDELEDKPLPKADADEGDDKVEVLETIESLHEMVPEEGANLSNGLVIVSSTEECETISQLDYTLDVNGDHSEDKPSEAQTIQVDHSREVTEDLKALTVVHVSSINEESGIAQVLEDTDNIEESSEIFVSTTEEPLHEAHVGEIEVSTEGRFEEEIPCAVTEVAEVERAALQEESTATLQQVTATMPDLMIQKNIEDSEKIAEETSIPCVDNAEVLDVPKNEVQFTEVEQAGIQGEKEEEIVLPEITNVDVQHTLVAQQATCTFKDVASHEPDVSIEKTTTIHEAIFSTVVSEQEEKEAIETTTPLEVNTITQVAQKSTDVVLMHVPGLEFEDNHQVQVQVVNIDIQSAETRVDTALEIGVQEDKEVVDSCFETVERVDSFSAISNIEEEMMSEEDQVAIQEVVQHVKELAPESEEQPEDKKLQIDLVDGKLSEDQKMIESHDEKADVAAKRDSVMTTKEQVLTKMDDDDKDQQPSAQKQVSAPDNTAVAVPQNTGVISSVGNIDAPSSLSLEFKLNIQFGPSRGPTLPSPLTHFTAEQSISSSPQSPEAAPPVDRNKPAKTTEMSEVGVQVVEEKNKQENELQRSQIVMAEAGVQAAETTEEPEMRETLKNEELMDVGIQYAEIEELNKKTIGDITAIEITQNKTALMDVSTQSTEISEQNEEVKTEETADADDQPVLTDVGTQSIHQEEIAENVKTTVEDISTIQITRTVQPEQDIEEKGVVLTELVVLQDSEDQSKQTEDEDENQEVWMDAEEGIDDQEQITTVPLCEIEESFESQPDYFQETKTDFEQSLENIKKIALKCDIDSEGEDFAVALEDPQIETAIATVEWD